MTAIAETDVVIAITRREDHNGMKEIWGTATFGDGALTYTTGGVPCAKAKFGFAKKTIQIDIQSVSTNYLCDYDLTNEKFYLKYCDYDAGADGVPIQFPNTTAFASTVVGFHAIGI